VENVNGFVRSVSMDDRDLDVGSAAVLECVNMINGNLNAAIVMDPKYVRIIKDEHTVKNVMDLRYVRMIKDEHTVKNVTDLRYVTTF
jgi:ABC-type histidine transport system ATPase subunit